MSDRESGSSRVKSLVKLWDAEASSFAPFKAAIMRNATAQDCMSIALPTSDHNHKRPPVFTLGVEKTKAHFMFHPCAGPMNSSPIAKMQLTFGDASPVFGSPGGGSPAALMTPVSQGATDGQAYDPNDLDVDNPIINAITGEAVTADRASTLLEVWLTKTNYKQEFKDFEDGMKKCEKQVKHFLSIVLEHSGEIVMESISIPYNARDAPGVWAKLLDMGEADQGITLAALHAKRNKITLKGTGNVTKMQAEMERLHKLIKAANDDIPSGPNTASIIQNELAHYQAFDVAIAILQAASCNDVDRWWMEMKKVETNSNVAVLGTLKKTARAHNVREDNEQGAYNVRETNAAACAICGDSEHKAPKCQSDDAVTCSAPKCGWKKHKSTIDCPNWRCPSNSRDTKPMKQKQHAKLVTQPTKTLSEEMAELKGMMTTQAEGLTRVNLSMQKYGAKVEKFSKKQIKLEKELKGESSESGGEEESS
jgi:hypothetical protein